MKNNSLRIDKIGIRTVIRLIKYIYYISPSFFILSCMFSIVTGFTSILSVYGLKLLINTISDVTVSRTQGVIKSLILYGIINNLDWQPIFR